MRYLKLIFLFVSLNSVSVGQVSDLNWPVFRGKSDLSGNTDFEFPASPVLVWSLPTGETTKSSPVLSNGVVYFGNDKGTLIAAGSDGKIKWKFETGSPVEAPPLIFSDRVFTGSSDGVLRSNDKSTGKLIWSYTTDNQIVGSANAWTSGKKSGIIFGSYDYYLHCVDPVTGKLLWKLETDNYVNGTPALGDNSIVFGGCDGIIRLTDPLTGKEKDTIEIGIYIAASPALSGGKAYLGDYDGGLYCDEDKEDILENSSEGKFRLNTGYTCSKG
jgi:outer membrane protein assembly factor BamB